jgi:hypothetical protein
MKTGKNGMLAVIALIGVITFVGGVQAAPVAWGEVNSTAAEGEIVEVWLDVNPSDYVTVGALDGDPDPDYWYVADLTPMLDRNGYTSGDTGINVTAAIYCSGTKRDIDGVSGGVYTNADRNVTAVHYTIKYYDGAFGAPLIELESCTAKETFSKTLYIGWNLISLPLTPDDNSVSAVFSGVSQDAVYRYNATSKQFESADAMNPGTGYFVHATVESAWEYSGTPYTSVDVSLKQGLNMVGWLNCSKDVDVLYSISGDYYYAACWNATAEKFDVYNPVAPSTFNDFTAMDRGTGYFISAKQECTLSESC